MADEEGGEKTEQASERKLHKAREQGQVAWSAELVAALSLGASALAMSFVLPWLGRESRNLLENAFDQIQTLSFTPAQATALITTSVWLVAPPIAIILVAGTSVSLGAGLVVTGFNISTEAISPNLDRLDPFQAFQKQFMSLAPWIKLLKALAVSLVLVWAVWAVMSERFGAMPQLANQGLAEQLPFLEAMAMGLLQRAIPAAIGIGILDLVYQRWKYLEDQKMTRQETRDEHRELEGDPQIKSRRKKLAREVALAARMLKDVPTADVIVVNPTHYAVALRYERGKDPAPVIIARGIDQLALQIRAEAQRHDILIVENRALARGLYAKGKLHKPIPGEYFPPVAQLIATVYRRRRQL